MRNRLRRFFAPPLQWYRANPWLNADQPEFSGQMGCRCSAMRSIASRALGFGVVVLVLIKDSLEWRYNAVAQLEPLPESVFWGILMIAVVVGLGMVTVVITRTVALLCIRNRGWHLNLGTRLVVALWLIALILSLNHPILLSWVWGILALVGVLMSGLLWWWSRSLEMALSQDLPQNHPPNKTANGEPTALETIMLGPNLWVQPEPSSQQPPQFTAFLFWLLGLFCWTMADFAPWFKGWLSIIMIAAGISGISTWRMGLLRQQGINYRATTPLNQSHQPHLDIHLWFDFQGWWGTQAQYVLPLPEFSQLWRVQLQEGGAEVEISWLKLVSDRREVVLPSLLTGIASRPPLENESEINPLEPSGTGIVEWLCHQGHFVVQERLQDSLSLIAILIPQGAGILAGILLLLIGLALSLMVEPIPKFMPEYTLGLLCLSWFSPWLARQIYDLLAPNALAVVLSTVSKINAVHIVEIAAGGLILLIAMVGHNHDQRTLVMFLVQIVSWLCVLVGAEVFRWVQRVPLVEKI